MTDASRISFYFKSFLSIVIFSLIISNVISWLQGLEDDAGPQIRKLYAEVALSLSLCVHIFIFLFINFKVS